MSTHKIILHLDMNSYFASVEQQANPHLRGVPVGVCEHLGGIIIAPSVEAKRLGIKLGTTVWDARKIYPKIVLLPVDPDKYRHVTAGFLRILMDYTDKVEKASIDEAFADLTGICKSYDDALLVGLEIKQRLRQEVGDWVSCSIGIGPNRLIAKIAADLDGGIIPSAPVILERSDRISRDSIGPSGLQNDKSFLDRVCVIRPEDVVLLYDHLKLTDIPGIAHRLERSLNLLGIFSLKELAQYPVANLLNQFGILGYELHKLANFDLSPILSPSPGERGSFLFPSPGDGEGERERSILSTEQIKSIGHSYTLPKVISDVRDIKKLMYKLAEKIGRRMRKQGAQGNVIHYFHSTPSFLPLAKGEVGRGSSFHKQHKITELINDGREIYKAAWGIFAKSCHCEERSDEAISKTMGLLRFARNDKLIAPRPIKIMGISVSGLKFDEALEPLFSARGVRPRPILLRRRSAFGGEQEPLFEKYKKPRWLVNAMDKINNKYGEFTIKRGRLIGIPKEWGKDTVGFGRMKERE